jgi:hypothetical protein
MSFSQSSTKRAKGPSPQELDMHVIPNPRVPRPWSSQVFFVFSALIHIAAAIALSCSWAVAMPRGKAPIDAPKLTPEQPTVARLAIDIAPVKFSEMKIEKLISRPQPQAVR